MTVFNMQVTIFWAEDA